MDLFVAGAHEIRTECMWSNFSAARSTTPRQAPSGLTVGTRNKLRSFSEAASLSFPDLDKTIDQGLERVAKDWEALVPYLLEMNRRLSAPGRRSDLRKGAPSDLTWTAWVESKRDKLGRSLRSVQRLLSGKTEASKERQAQPRASLAQGSTDAPEIPGTPMGIASEMARLILQGRDESQNSRLTGRLELLAQQFLNITGQVRVPEKTSAPSARVGSTPNESGWKM